MVIRAEAAMLTTLFPMRMVLSILLELDITFSRIAAFLFPCSFRDWTRILFTVVMEVSAEEKNADRAARTTIPAACMGTLESKTIFNSFCNETNPCELLDQLYHTIPDLSCLT